MTRVTDLLRNSLSFHYELILSHNEFHSFPFTFKFIFSVARLEEKEAEHKKEYTKLHERYSELFKNHLDYMEKTKSMLGADKIEQLQQGVGSSRPRISGMALNQLSRLM